MASTRKAQKNASGATKEPVVSTPEAAPEPLQSANSAPSRKKLMLFGLVGVLIGLVIAGAAFVYYVNSRPKIPIVAQIKTTPQPSPMSDSSQDWKTYTSKYGYTFQYPSSWGVEDSEGDKGAQIWSKPEYFALTKTEEQNRTFNKEDFARIEVSEYLNGTDTAFGKVSSSTDLRSFVNKFHGDTVKEITDTTIDGKPAILVTQKRTVAKEGFEQNCPNPEICMEENGEVKYLWAKVNGNILSIHYWYGREYQEPDALDAIFTEFLSSFKFTK